MKIEDFLNKPNIVELSFFNFRNAITAAYFANDALEIQKVNDNFKSFFPVLGNVTNAYFPHVLEQLAVPSKQIEEFTKSISEKGTVLIPEIHITIEGIERVFSLLSTHTLDDAFTYLNGVQGQFVDRTAEWNLKKEREVLLEQRIRDREVIEEKNQQLEVLATKLGKYLSPQIYESVFSEASGQSKPHARKNLTIFFSDIVQFTDLSDTLEPERLAAVINSYLSEMSAIAIECGGTIDKFIGDAILVFYGDPDTEGEVEDALRCLEMAIRMQIRVAEMQKYWKKQGISQGLHVRMGVTTGYCTVGNFGSEQRLDYTVLGSPVNLAARLQAMAEPDCILIDENTYNLVGKQVKCQAAEQILPKGFVRSVQTYQVEDFDSAAHIEKRQLLYQAGDRVEVSIIDSSNIRAAIEELRMIQLDFEKRLDD